MPGSIGAKDAEAMQFAAGQVTDLDEVPSPIKTAAAHTPLTVAAELARGRSIPRTVHEATRHLVRPSARSSRPASRPQPAS